MQDILQLAPPLALALGLNVVGVALKKSPVANWMIPWVLIILGAVAFPFISDYSKINFQCAYPWVLNGIYGAAIGGLSVGLHQGITGLLEKKHSGGATTFTKKDSQ